jgi:hypothetical protein
MGSKRSGTLAIALAVAVLGTTACDRSPVDPPGHAALGTVEILNRATTPHSVLATWTHGNGWDRDVLMTLSHAAEDHRTRVSLGARMFTRGGDPIELVSGGEYSVRYGVASDPNNIINMDTSLGLFHGDHVHIYGFNDTRPTGTAQLVFALWHDGHSDGETDPIGITITN